MPNNCLFFSYHHDQVISSDSPCPTPTSKDCDSCRSVSSEPSTHGVFRCMFYRWRWHTWLISATDLEGDHGTHSGKEEVADSSLTMRILRHDGGERDWRVSHDVA